MENTEEIQGDLITNEIHPYFITGTQAIRTDAGELTFKDALLRSLCRLVPFEPFSGFGLLWHDSWTNTMVVKK